MKRTTLTVCGIALAMVAGTIAGCGGSSKKAAPTTVAHTTTIAPSQVAVAPAGSPSGSIAVASTAAVTSSAPVQTGATAPVTAVSIPASTVIIPPQGVVFSTTNPPVITVKTPTDAATTAKSGLPEIKPANGTAFKVASSAGAVDISLSGTTSFTLSSPATVNIPVNAVLSNPVTVYSVKADGTTTQLSGTYSLDTNGNKIVSVSTSNFCWFVVKPVPVSTTGSTGGTK